MENELMGEEMFTMLEMNELLAFMQANKASDLHLIPGRKPLLRIDGILQDLDFEILNSEIIKRSCYSILSDIQKATLEEDKN